MFQKILFSNYMGQNRTGSASLNELLEQPDNLPKLLEQDSFLSQFKSGTARIKEYMTYDRFLEMTQYVTVVGDQSDKRRGYKFPLTSCELLTSDNSKIQEYFLPASGVIIVEEKITKSVEHEVEQEIQDDDDEEEAQKQPKQKETVEQPKQPANTEQTAIQEKPKPTAEGEQEQFGDFIETPPKKKKIVKVKEVIDTIEIIKHQKEPLINLLFEYFSRPINYTLTGYVSKILVSLLNKKPLAFLAKLFESPNSCPHVFQDIFSHLGSRSTVDLLTRIFTIENKSYMEERYLVFVKMIEYLNQTDSLDSLINISACVSQVFDKTAAHLKSISSVKELSLYSSKIAELLQKLVEFFLGENQTAATHSIQIIWQLISIVFAKEEEKRCKEYLGPFLEGASKRLQAFLKQERPKLGPQAVKLMESLNLCIKTEEALKYFSTDTQIYPTLLSLVQKYPLNNIFHNQVFRFLSSSLLSSFPELTKHTIDSCKLLQWLQGEGKQEEERSANKTSSPKKGYAGHICNLCRLLKANASKHESINNIVQDQRFYYAVKIILEQEEASSEKMLGGLSKKQIKHPVMHNKEDILSAHASFLAATPPPVQQTELDDPALNPILLAQLQQQLDGVEMPNEAMPEEVIQQQKHKAVLIEQNEHHKAAFWKMHLDYDVDGLIDEIL